MALFVVRHQHAASTCPAGDPDAGAMMPNHLSRSNVRQHIEILGEAVVKGEHVLHDRASPRRSVGCNVHAAVKAPRFGTAEVARHRRARKSLPAEAAPSKHRRRVLM